MIKILLKIGFVLCLFISNSYSQTSRSSVNFFGGYVGNKSYGAMVLYNYLDNRNNYEFGGYHNQFVDNSYMPIKYNITGVQLGYSYNAIVSEYNTFIFNIGLGLNGGVVKIENPNNYLLVSKDGFEYGAYAFVGMDIFISNHLSLVLRGQENYSINSKSGKLNPFFGAGVKINF